FIQPYWVGDSVNTPKPGYFGLFHYCVGSGLAGRELAGRGALPERKGIPPALVKEGLHHYGRSDCKSLSFVVSLVKTRHCHPRAPSDVSPSSPLQPSAALCLVLGCMIFPDGWDAETIRDMCGEKTGKYSLGDCSVRWAYILAIIGILNALILSFLAFVLGNRQNDLLHEELKTESK
ncbi:Lipoma HMGIC fusion partner-like 4, partial [Tauraco erythrolophus]